MTDPIHIHDLTDLSSPSNDDWFLVETAAGVCKKMHRSTQSLVYCPDEYGAAGNGTTDDSAAFAAIFTKINNDYHGSLWLTPGRVYVVNSLPALMGLTGFTVHGNGAELRLPSGSFSELTPVLSLQKSTGIRIQDLVINGMRVPANDVYLKGAGIQLLACDGVVIDNCHIHHVAGDSIYAGNNHSAKIPDDTRTTRLTVRNCELDNSLRHGLFLQSVRGVRVENTYFHTMHTADRTHIVDQIGLNIGPDADGDTYAVEDVHITGCRFEDNGEARANEADKRYALAMTGSTRTFNSIWIDNNTFVMDELKGQNGILLTGRATGLHVLNNRLIGGQYGIRRVDDQSVMMEVDLSGNKFYGQTLCGLSVAETQDNKIAGWTIGDNLFRGDYKLLSVQTGNSKPIEIVLHDNQYLSTGNTGLAAGANVVEYLGSCTVNDETYQRPADPANLYSIYANNSDKSVLCHNLVISPGGKLKFVDAGIAEAGVFAGVQRIVDVWGKGLVTWYGADKPAVGTWAVGARVIHSDPTSGQKAEWVCVAAGSSAVWQSTTLS